MIEYRHEEGADLLKFFGDVQTFIADQTRSRDLFSAHWAEIANNKDLLQLDVDYVRYRRLVESNALVIVTARDGGVLIGYISIIVSLHLHYKTVLMSLEDIHYIDPKYRNQGIGSGMIKTAEKVLTERGVKLATMRTKVHADHGDLLKELGYSPVETVYGKRLGI